ncbi:hypothetical protein, partial [Corynebacterium striatum]|uniref:hypothetical protein n=1 Tax=Corynebacterium striatum TaxID=43770 RepID=UPI0027BA4156
CQRCDLLNGAKPTGSQCVVRACDYTVRAPELLFYLAIRTLFELLSAGSWYRGYGSVVLPVSG